MSPRESQPDTYVCDQCGTTKAEPLPSGWFEVDRPSGVEVVFLGDWWGQTRYFCSAACLRARLDKD
jgi:hypothetical protein